MITSSYGFRSAQSAYENASPYDNECDCQPLFVCDCGDFSLSAGTCTECNEAFAEVDRDESTEGILTEASCNLHNHNCTSRDCCD
jgi:hypothetical protein